MSQRKAFSLLEIMIVLVLMAGIIAIAWPSISRPMRKAELSEATQKLREAIEDGRYQAMVAGAPVFLQIKQGESEIRSGGMESLLSGELDRDNDEADVGAGRSSYVDGNMSKPQEHAPHGLFGEHSLHGQHSLGVPSRVWKLPENIVVSTVTWIDESDSDEGDSFGGDSLQKADSETPLNESDLTNASQHETWCLPMTAEGRGRDAEITLWDKKARQTITVTFTAATGELEIAR